MKDKKENSQNNPFPQMEEEVLNFWEKAKIFEKSVERDPLKGDYVFYDGPPFATGLPHYGHIVASIMKDVVPRYWTMRGYRVERKWGWDCHGLPIENIVEKELGSKSKKDIEKIGVAKFNETCRSKVLSYVDEWKKVMRRLGRWADMENSYKTMDLDFMESVWWTFKELWDRDLIYEGYRSMHVCPRCETTLSQSEVTEGYKDIKDLSVVVKFELEDEPKTFVAAWTTTPWTLIGNVALAVGEDIEYCAMKIIDSKDKKFKNKDTYIFSKKYFDENFNVVPEAYGEIEGLRKYPHYLLHDYGKTKVEIKEFKGKELIGKKYKPLFDYYKNKKLENKKNGWKIYSAGFVNTDEGTGIVHIAPAFGEDDMNLGKENNLPFIQHVSMDGNFKDEVVDFKGLNVKPKDNHMATDIEILKFLAKKDLIISKEKYEHSYPHCWRCDTPLINYATSSWFVKVADIKEDLLKTAKDIDWSPSHIKKGRFGKCLEGARDWSISRQRFWASVIPIWVCECGEKKVIGSVRELEKLSGEKITDLHKHVIDKIKFPCEKCSKEMSRVPDVLDTWFDSGSMPYAQMHYPFENKEKFEKNFPAKFIGEGADQTRAWFYYLHVIATGIKKSRAYNNVIVNGIVLAEDGKKMSKKLQNYPDPKYILNKYGSDALRCYLLSSSVMLAENLFFSEEGVGEALRKSNMLLWNVYKFYEMFGDPNIEIQRIEAKNILDRWILVKADLLVEEVAKNMEAYSLPGAMRPIIYFINDLSTWYLRRSRDRFKGEDEKDKKDALKVTKYVLVELSKVMAPFMPFIAEQIWQKVTGNNFGDQEKSVHLEAWTKSPSDKKDRQVLEEMKLTRKIIEMGLAKRDEVGIRVRQPLSELKVKNCELQDEYANLIKDELNIKKISFKKSDGELTLELTTDLTDDLILEGLKREITRLINSMRKKAGLTIHDKISIYINTQSKEIKKAINKYKEEIKKETLAKEIKQEKKDKDFLSEKKADINGEEIAFEIKKV